MRDIATEMATPKYAHCERERRWLADASALSAIETSEVTRIEDHYIDGSRLRLRRMTQSSASEPSLKLTKKYGGPDELAQPIVTTYLDFEEFRLFEQLPAARLIKDRHSFLHQAHSWSLDIFNAPHEGFAILEVEADEAALPILSPPAWAGREVTGDPRYSCASLARDTQTP